MNIASIKNLNFKSHIKVVSPKDYNNVVKELEVDTRYDDIMEYFIKPLCIFPDSFKAYRTNVLKGSTEEIRSCTAGLVFDKKSEAPLFFHIYDDSSNINNLSVIEPYMKGENAILIGSRTKFKKSRELFKTIEKMLDSKSIPMTVFEDFENTWEADMAYDSQKDEVYLCVKDIMNPKMYVKTMDELLKAFKRVQISSRDTIEFLAEKTKEVVKKI